LQPIAIVSGEDGMLDFIWNGTKNLPGIHQVLTAFWQLTADGTLLRCAVASLFRVTVGFYCAVLLAVPLGLMLGRRVAFNRWANVAIQFLRPISPLAWIPFAMLWFGVGDMPALFIIFIAAFFPILLSTIEASASIHPMYFQVGANLQFSRLEVFRFIILPVCLPNIVLALRISLGISWMVVVAAEMIAVRSGLGFLIMDGRNALRLDYVMVAMIAIGLLGLLLDRLMTGFERIDALRWNLERK